MELAQTRRCHANTNRRKICVWQQGKRSLRNYAGDNLPNDNLCHADIILRSPHAHATTSAALTFRHLFRICRDHPRTPGVLTVLTSKPQGCIRGRYRRSFRIARTGRGHQTRNFGCPKGLTVPPSSAKNSDRQHTSRRLKLSAYVGEGVALVVAETARIRRSRRCGRVDRCGLIIAPLPASRMRNSDCPRSSMKGGAVQIWPDCP